MISPYRNSSLTLFQPQATSFNRTTPSTAFLAVILAFSAISDLTSAAMTEHVAAEYWLTQVPIRLSLLFGLTSYTYLSKPSVTSKFYAAAPGDNLKNGLVFSWAFIELVGWFLVFITLREERRQRGARRVGA